MKHLLLSAVCFVSLTAGAQAQVFYVDQSRGGNGTSWATAFQMIDSAINAANAGDEVWVAAAKPYPNLYSLASNGTDKLTVKDGVSLYGGFNGTETSRAQRNPKVNVTTIVMRWNVPLVQDKPTVIDGFYFLSGQEIPLFLGAPGSSGTGLQLTISNNTFQTQGFCPASIMTHFTFKCSATIQGNIFSLGSRYMVISGGAPKILNNSMSLGGLAGGPGVQLGELGVYGADSTGAVIANNVFWGMGILVLNRGVLVANNTIVGSGQYGLRVTTGAIVANNIIAFVKNGVGIFTFDPITEHHNLLFNTTNYSNDFFTGLPVHPTDKIVDPAFVDLMQGDLRLTAASPARNAGDNNVVQAGWTDIGNNARILETTVDMGGYEFGGSSAPPPPGTNPPPTNPPPPVTVLTLNLPSVLSVNATISALVPPSWTVTRFDWTFTPAASTPSPQLRTPKFTLHAPGGSLSTFAASASLASLNLSPGAYTITVTAYNGSTLLGTAQASTNLVLADLGSSRIYPNPWRASQHVGYPVTFDQLTANTTIKIFTVSGHLVKELPITHSSVTWDLTNDSGDKVASGIYLYLITADGDQKKTGQITVIK